MTRELRASTFIGMSADNATEQMSLIGTELTRRTEQLGAAVASAARAEIDFYEYAEVVSNDELLESCTANVSTPTSARHPGLASSSSCSGTRRQCSSPRRRMKEPNSWCGSRQARPVWSGHRGVLRKAQDRESQSCGLRSRPCARVVGSPPWRRSFSLPRRQVITGPKVCPLASPMGTKVPRKRHTRA